MPFNSREYEFADITVVVGGRDLLGLRGLKISEKVEREAVYAKGRLPHSIQSGNMSFDGEITVLQSDYEALIKAGNGSLLTLAFDVVCGYGNPLEGNTPIYKRAVGARFTEAALELKQGDKFGEIALPFICLNWKHEN